MVCHGWVLDYERYSGGYAAEQLEAEQAHRGLWLGRPSAPMRRLGGRGSARERFGVLLKRLRRRRWQITPTIDGRRRAG
jgi:hypothetical protein